MTKVRPRSLLGGMQVLAGVGEVSLLLCPDAAALSAAFVILSSKKLL
jgi:hypothetical protein